MKSDPKETPARNEELAPVKSPYTFDNPSTAAEIFRLLEDQEPIPEEYFNLMPPDHNHYGEAHLGLIRDQGYCQRVRKLICEKPWQVFGQNNIFTDLSHHSKIRKELIPSVGTDCMNISTTEDSTEFLRSRTQYLRRGITNFFTYNRELFSFQEIGTEFSCINQASNHIPGMGVLYRNDLFPGLWDKYRWSYSDRKECYDFDKFYPKIWNLDIKEECEDFFKYRIINKVAKHDKGVLFMKKMLNPKNNGVGVVILNDLEEELLQKTYEEGLFCGTHKLGDIIQSFIHNPLLLDGHKFEFRIYLLIASTNPLIAYYHDGFLRLALKPYNIDSNDPASIFTSIKLDKNLLHEILDSHALGELDEEGIKNFRLRTLKQFHEYALSHNITQDRNWLNSYLRPQFKKAMVHIVRSIEGNLLARSSVYELIGLDFIMDEDLHLWFTDANMKPLIFGAAEDKMELHMRMLGDMFEIITGLVRSRMHRIFLMIKKIEEMSHSNSLRPLDPEQRAENMVYYEDISKNYFEPDFMISSSNGFELIVDDNLNGHQKYAGLIDKDCL
jgi:tubulin polyglutamylase TTLL1